MYSRLISRILLPLALIATVFAVSACDNVGVEPKGLAAADNIFQEDGAYRSYLAKLYAGLSTTGQQGATGDPDIQGISDEGFSQYVRLWWQMQELPTDEAVLAFPDTPVEEMNAGNWGAENGFISGMYSRVSFQVTQANNFLRESTPGKLDERNVGPEVQQQISQWRAEARFLRALSYWHGLDLYGGIPIVTEENPVGGAPPSPNSRQEVFEFVEEELIAITNGEGEENLSDPGQSQYGRADKAAAYMVLANLYLNAEVYIGEARYSDAIEYASRVIDSGAFTLQTSSRGSFSPYQSLFLADNDRANGIIFSVPQDGENTQHFGGTQFLIAASLGAPFTEQSLVDNYGTTQAYQGLRVTETSYNLFNTTEDDRADIFVTRERDPEITAFNDFGQGYLAPKYRNLTSQGNPGSSLVFPDTDYPMFRLAEAYLIYAEATLRGENGDEARAQTLINDLRQRAGLGRDVGTSNGPSLTLDLILDERGRELFWEARRRMDLIRYGLFTGGELTWAGKNGGYPDGGALDGEYRALYPIPASELQTNPNLEQNDGY